MAGIRPTLPRWRAVGDDGLPLAGAKLWTYTTETSTPKATYSDVGLTIANANPIVADAGGLFGEIFLDAGDYRFVLMDANDVTVWTSDPVAGASDALLLTGGTLTGPLILAADPVQALQAVTKQYVDVTGRVIKETTGSDATTDSTTSTTMGSTSLVASIAPAFSDSIIEVIALVTRYNISRVAGTTTERRGTFRLFDATNTINGDTVTVGRQLDAGSSATAASEGALTLVHRFAAMNTSNRNYRLQFASLEATNVQVQVVGTKRMIVREIRP